MSISEIHTYFKVLLNKLDSFNYQNLEPEEIDVFLNQAMFRLIEQRAYGNNPKRETIEETQKRVDDLNNITNPYSTTVFSTDSYNKTNGKYVTLPIDYRHAMQEECTISYTDCNGVTQTKKIPVKPVTHDRFNKITRDPFNKPDENLVLRLAHSKVNGNQVFELIGNGSVTFTTYYLTYLRTPVSMRYGSTYSTPTTDVECELSEHLHREIVEMAIRSAIEVLESPRVSTYTQIVKETE